MLTTNGAMEPLHLEEPKKGSFPWMPLFAAVGIAAAAFFLIKKMASDDDMSNVKTALEQCDKAALTLAERMESVASTLVG